MPNRPALVPAVLKADKGSKWKDYPSIARWSAGGVLRWDVFVLLVLIFLLLCRNQRWLWINHLPTPIGGMLPLIVPWAGALGGVGISFVGVASHFADWGPKAKKGDAAADHPGFEQRVTWNAWHISRPFLGALFGSVAALAVVFVFGTFAQDKEGNLDASPLGTATLFVVAFIVGYRDATFRDLADRVIDTIFGPGASIDSTSSYDLSTSELDFGDVKVNEREDQTVIITNNGKQMLRMTKPVVAGAGFALASTNGNLGALATDEIKIKFEPTAPGDATGTLAVKAGGVEKTVHLKAKAV